VKIKKAIAVMVVVLISIMVTLTFYNLYLYDVYLTNRYLRNGSTGGSQIRVVVVKILPGAGSNPRIGFEPAVISIVIGVNNTVIWENEDSTWHTAHSNIPEFYSNYIEPGGNFTHTFESPGIYPYHCDPHPWMTGKITVYSPSVTGTTIQTFRASFSRDPQPEFAIIIPTAPNFRFISSSFEF
jgi:plastocyanin